MVQTCAVPGCVHSKKEQKQGVVSFHRFPVDRWGLCKRWLGAVGNPEYNERTDKNTLKALRVCGDHFTPEDFRRNLMAEMMDQGKRRKPRTWLQDNAVPSVFPQKLQPLAGRTEVCFSVPISMHAKQKKHRGLGCSDLPIVFSVCNTCTCCSQVFLETFLGLC